MGFLFVSHRLIAGIFNKDFPLNEQTILYLVSHWFNASHLGISNTVKYFTLIFLKIFQSEDLLNEIKELKEEIKKKDEKIQLLENQLVSIVCMWSGKSFSNWAICIFNKTLTRIEIWL